MNLVLEFFCFLLQLQLKDLLCNAGFPDGMFYSFWLFFPFLLAVFFSEETIRNLFVVILEEGRDYKPPNPLD